MHIRRVVQLRLRPAALRASLWRHTRRRVGGILILLNNQVRTLGSPRSLLPWRWQVNHDHLTVVRSLASPDGAADPPSRDDQEESVLFLANLLAEKGVGGNRPWTDR